MQRMSSHYPLRVLVPHLPIYSEACGGPNLVSVYNTGTVLQVLPVPTPMTTNLPGDWSYAGCLREPTNGQRMFRYENEWPTNNSALACMNQCATFGYTAAGVEVSQKSLSHILELTSFSFLFSTVYNAVRVTCLISWCIVVNQLLL